MTDKVDKIDKIAMLTQMGAYLESPQYLQQTTPEDRRGLRKGAASIRDGLTQAGVPVTADVIFAIFLGATLQVGVTTSPAGPIGALLSTQRVSEPAPSIELALAHLAKDILDGTVRS